MSDLYVVTRENWRRLATGPARLPGAVDVAAYPTPGEAAAERDRREAAARAAVNPFTWGDSLFDVTRLAPYALSDWLQEAGLSPPPADAPRPEWAAWWTTAAGEMSAGQAETAWQAFDKLRIFHVAERPRRQAVHVVTSIPWGSIDDDDYQYTGSRSASFEGGLPRVFSLTSAATMAAGRNIGTNWSDNDHDAPYITYDVGGRARFAADPLGLSLTGEVRRASDPAGIRRFDVTPVELVADPGDVPYLRRVAVVVRLGWASASDEGLDFRHWAAASADSVCGVPVVAYADRARAGAEADAWARDVIARRTLNPFRFGHPQDLTRLNEVAYRAMLAGLDLPLPSGTWTEYIPHGQRDWVEWYESVSSLLGVNQWEMVWDMLDQLRFHLVVDLDLHG